MTAADAGPILTDDAPVAPGRGGRDHQIVLAVTRTWDIKVSCTCLRRAAAGPIGVRRRWAHGEAYSAWLAHAEQAMAGPVPVTSGVTS
jgi:hypothetical protein